jgi:hypothetical protein
MFFFLVYGVLHPFQQYFSFIVAVSLLVEETGVPGGNHQSTYVHDHDGPNYNINVNSIITESMNARSYLPTRYTVVRSNPAHGEVYSIQHYVIKFVSDLRQVDGFLHQYN